MKSHPQTKQEWPGNEDILTAVNLQKTPWLNVSLPACLCRRRDRARLEMNRIFGEVIQARRANKGSPDEEEEDILGILLNTTYK